MVVRYPHFAVEEDDRWTKVDKQRFNVDGYPTSLEAGGWK